MAACMRVCVCERVCERVCVCGGGAVFIEQYIHHRWG